MLHPGLSILGGRVAHRGRGVDGITRGNHFTTSQIRKLNAAGSTPCRKLRGRGGRERSHAQVCLLLESPIPEERGGSILPGTLTADIQDRVLVYPASWKLGASGSIGGVQREGQIMTRIQIRWSV